jgi:LemA protein
MYARRFYNSNVRDLNIAIESFPSNIVASIFGFKKMDLFEISAPEEREAPKVKF